MKPVFGEVECPHCFDHIEVNTDSFSRPTGFLSEEKDISETECPECGKRIKITRTVKIEFHARK